MGEKHGTEDDDEWEAWTMHADGIVASYPLSDSAAEGSDESLLVSRAGPMCRVGQRSVAVGFGNTVKLLAIGNERYEGEDGNDDIFQIPRKARLHHHRR